jgi:hypothetical protein
MNSRKLPLKLYRLRLAGGIGWSLLKLNLHRTRRGCRCLLLLLPRGFGCPKELAAFVRLLLRIRGAGCLKRFLTETREPGALPLLNTASGTSRIRKKELQAPRSIRLQRAIVRHYLGMQFDIHPTEADLDAFSRAASLKRLASGLIRAAGCGTPATLSREDLYRCRVVYPVYASLFRLQSGVRLTFPQGIWLRLRRFLLRKRLLPRPGFACEEFAGLYPPELSIARDESRRALFRLMRERETGAAGRLFARESFALHLAALDVLAAAPVRESSAVERLLARFEDICRDI